ncbi:hypothetical protein CDAR_101751 [Caerostris darwini]|uniref:Uncharacterized protein n=1 Tax=Caerostris darwini TaxID=1538125 RepID=A0AAV4S7H6_9ARAC|nr:hypothetical protein CDAR_101751 [Caerostris darwini]
MRKDEQKCKMVGSHFSPSTKSTWRGNWIAPQKEKSRTHLSIASSVTDEKNRLIAGVFDALSHSCFIKTKCSSSSVEHRTSVHRYEIHSRRTQGAPPSPSQNPPRGNFPSFALFHAIIVCRRLSFRIGYLSLFPSSPSSLMATHNGAVDEILDWGFGKGWSFLRKGKVLSFLERARARQEGGMERRKMSSGFYSSLIDGQSFPWNRLREEELMADTRVGSN